MATRETRACTHRTRARRPRARPRLRAARWPGGRRGRIHRRRAADRGRGVEPQHRRGARPPAAHLAGVLRRTRGLPAGCGARRGVRAGQAGAEGRLVTARVSSALALLLGPARFMGCSLRVGAPGWRGVNARHMPRRPMRSRHTPLPETSGIAIDRHRHGPCCPKACRFDQPSPWVWRSSDAPRRTSTSCARQGAPAGSLASIGRASSTRTPSFASRSIAEP